MATRSLIIVMISLYCLCLPASGRVVPLSAHEDRFQPLCSRMCQSSKNSTDSLLPPYQCSCSQSCAVYGDCCYDSPYKDTNSPLQFQFVCLHMEGRDEFQAISNCPADKRSDSCRELLGYLPPVTSRITNVTYGNVFCATCNGDDKSLVRWKVQLRCSSENDWLDFSRIMRNLDKFWARNALEKIWESCKFHVHNEDFGFLNGLELRPCELPEKVSRCSRTWRGSDVEQKCRSYEDPVYIGNTLYQNSHCAECNYKDLGQADCIPDYVKDLLEQGTIDESYLRACMVVSPYSCLRNLGRGFIQSLADMFNPDHTVEISQTGCLPVSGKRCCAGERYDDLIGGCRKTRKG